MNLNAIVVSRVALLAVLFCGGCGRQTDQAIIVGKFVRKDGTPLVGARIVARSKEAGKTVYSYTDGEGKFELAPPGSKDGIPPGTYEVIVLEDLGSADNPNPPSISKIYVKASTSGLQFTAKPGESVELNAELDGP